VILMNEALRAFEKKLREDGAPGMADQIATPKLPGGRATGRKAEDEATAADSARPRSMGVSDEATRIFWARYHAGEIDPNADNEITDETEPRSIPTKPMTAEQRRRDKAGRKESALDAFTRVFREQAGVSSGVCHDEAKDQRAGDAMAGREDPEYADRWADYDGLEDDLDPNTLPPNYQDGAPIASRAGRDKSRHEDEQLRHTPPHTDRFGQARSDQKSYVDYFADKGEEEGDTMTRADVKCPHCGKKGRMASRIVRGADPKPVRAKCGNGKCAESFWVAPPKGFGFDRKRAKEASALRHFMSRYLTGKNPDAVSGSALSTFKRSIRDSRRGGMPE
jgi:hypothetical protein